MEPLSCPPSSFLDSILFYRVCHVLREWNVPSILVSVQAAIATRLMYPTKDEFKHLS